MVSQANTILIVGGGMAGMTAALHIAEAGQRALVIDSAPVIGGALLLLDKTFPTNSCGICFMAPNPPALCPFIECESHPNIELVPNTMLTNLTGEPGQFTAQLMSAPALVDAARCTNCGLCAEVCPATRQAGHLGAHWLDEESKAIYQPFPQGVPASYVIDVHACTHCGACVDMCPYDAINLAAKTTTRTEVVSAVILASGFGPNDAYVRGAYGYDHYTNVISSLEYERMLSTSSPSRGRAIRLSDGQPAERIAIIHCVGSRDQSCGVPYCSATCCMIAAKQAALTIHRNPQTEVVVFTMDVRAAGRGYERYMQDLQQQQNIIYRRSLISGVKLNPQTQQLRLEYAEDGRSHSESFDLVVLEVGMVVPPIVRTMVGQTGVQMNKFGFAITGQNPTVTSRAGVFAAGALTEPKDIPATVTQAIAAAAQALAIGEMSVTPTTRQSVEQAMRIPDLYEPLRLGIFFDGTDPEIAMTLDLRTIVTQLRAWSDVTVAELMLNKKNLQTAIKQQELTHIICVQRSVRHNGLACHVLDGVPITQLALGADGLLTQQNCGTFADQKTLQLLRMTIERVRLMRPQVSQIDRVEPRAIVLGGGGAGLMAAQTLSARGIETHLIERRDQLGGWLIQHEIGEKTWLTELIDQVSHSPFITVHLKSTLTAVQGRAGHYRAHVTTPIGEDEIPFGTLVVATGAQSFDSAKIKKNAAIPIVTQYELAEQIAHWQDEEAGKSIPASIVMIQCVGDKIGERPYCSRTCCVEALRNALALKKLAPQTRITILFRDIVTPGFDELLYTEARRQGILFLRYIPTKPPQLDDYTVSIWDDVLAEQLNLRADMVVLSSGIVPDAETAHLAQILNVPLDEDGFFAPLNIKTQALDLPAPGNYLAGLAGGPATLAECLEQGLAAGLRAALFVQRDRQTAPTVATVNERMCSGCGLCVQVCPFRARSIDEVTGVAQVDEWLCAGCGACVAICPNGASGQATLEAKGILASLTAALGG